MAINKNFVIKNGVEVNTNLLVGDSTLNKVGIATTVPGYTLHVGVGGGARGGIGATDITVSGIATIGVANSTSAALSVTGISTFDGLIDANGGVSARTAAVQDLTAQRVVLAGTGGELEDSANLTFDGSTLSVSGDLDPTNVSIASTLQVAGVATFLSGTLVSGIGTFESDVDAEGTVTVGTGITLQPHGGASFAGIVTVGGDLLVGGDYTVDEISARNLSLTGIATIGTGVTLQPHGGGSFAGIVTTGGVIDANGGINAATAKIEDLTDNRIVIAGTGGELEDSGNLTFDGSTLAVTGDETVSGKITVGTGASIHSSTGNAAFAGIVTTGGALIVGAGATISGDILPDADGSRDLGSSTLEFQDLFIDGTANVDTLQVDENATVTGNLTVNGNVDLGDATSDTITPTGRFDADIIPASDGAIDLGATGAEFQDLFIDGTANIDSLAADTAAIGDLTDNRVVIAGSSGELEDDANLTFDGAKLGIGAGTGATVFLNGNATFSGIVTASQFQGGGVGVGIGSTTALVGYGFTFINFKGPGVSTVYASNTTGIATIFFQGGGSSVGAAGTWQNDGDVGISTAKSVGINTVGIAVTSLQGGEKGASTGIGASFQGLYIANGMMITDNALNGNHYIGTGFNGLMAGPITVNGYVTVDGNFAVV
jgi:hypothetical protein